MLQTNPSNHNNADLNALFLQYQANPLQRQIAKGYLHFGGIPAVEAYLQGEQPFGEADGTSSPEPEQVSSAPREKENERQLQESHKVVSAPKEAASERRLREICEASVAKPVYSPARETDVQGKLSGELALICAQEQLEAWKERLGVAYPLVLVAVKAALEAGHTVEGENARRYHFFSTQHSLGLLCAALEGRETPYSDRTIRRWLHPKARHATALRAWLGWRDWTTDSYKDYVTGEARPTIGGTLFRVYLQPLLPESLNTLVEQEIQQRAELADEYYRNCPPQRFPKTPIKLLFEELKRLWRDLEQDRHAGRTARTCGVTPGEIKLFETLYDEAERLKLVFSDARERVASTGSLLEPEYLYPDTRTERGVLQLVEDLNHAAQVLMFRIQGSDMNLNGELIIDRYRAALWVAIKEQRYTGNSRGFELLRRGMRLAAEIRQETAYPDPNRKPLRDIAAYVWSVLEREGFEELRRDYSYEPGKPHYPIFSKRIALNLGFILV